MSRKNRYIEKLTLEEQELLKSGVKTGKNHRFRTRCRGILLSHQGYTVNELCDILDVKLASVYKWFNRWESGGFEALKDQGGRGRKPILKSDKAEHVTKVKQAVERSPKNLNKVLSEIKEDLEVDLSKLTLKRFLKNLTSNGNDSDVSL